MIPGYANNEFLKSFLQTIINGIIIINLYYFLLLCIHTIKKKYRDKQHLYYIEREYLA